MQKTVLKNAKRFWVILYLVAIVPIVAYFGKNIGETVFDKAKTSDEIFHHYGSWGIDVHHDEWEILQILTGEDQIYITQITDYWEVVINEDNREQILDDFLNVRICKLTLECIAVLLVMGLAFIGMSYRGFYIPAWGIVLGIEMIFAQYGAFWTFERLSVPDAFWNLVPDAFWNLVSDAFWKHEWLLWAHPWIFMPGIVVGTLLFILLYMADWIQIKSGFNFRFTFLRITGCFVVDYGITLFCTFYPLRYTDDVLSITVLIPAFFISLLLVFVLRMVQLVIRRRHF